jgi:hypothetical protein
MNCPHPNRRALWFEKGKKIKKITYANLRHTIVLGTNLDLIGETYREKAEEHQKEVEGKPPPGML